MNDTRIDIRPPTEADAEAIARIHQLGLQTGHASFRDLPLHWPEFQQNYMTGRSVALLASKGAQIAGWATIMQSSTRAVYAGVGEVSIYMDPAARGQGIGKALLMALIETSEAEGYWTLFGHIFPENTASIALHAATGFETIGRRKAIGKMSYGPMANKWRDVLLMERRSTMVGIDPAE